MNTHKQMKVNWIIIIKCNLQTEFANCLWLLINNIKRLVWACTASSRYLRNSVCQSRLPFVFCLSVLIYSFAESNNKPTSQQQQQQLRRDANDVPTVPFMCQGHDAVKRRRRRQLQRQQRCRCPHRRWRRRHRQQRLRLRLRAVRSHWKCQL